MSLFFKKDCENYGGVCVTTRDAYFYVAPVVFLLGVAWLVLFYKIIRKMSKMSQEEWKLKKKH
jgi:hypothetical protein